MSMSQIKKRGKKDILSKRKWARQRTWKRYQDRILTPSSYALHVTVPFVLLFLFQKEVKVELSTLLSSRLYHLQNNLNSLVQIQSLYFTCHFFFFLYESSFDRLIYKLFLNEPYFAARSLFFFLALCKFLNSVVHSVFNHLFLSSHAFVVATHKSGSGAYCHLHLCNK